MRLLERWFFYLFLEMLPSLVFEPRLRLDVSSNSKNVALTLLSFFSRFSFDDEFIAAPFLPCLSLTELARLQIITKSKQIGGKASIKCNRIKYCTFLLSMIVVLWKWKDPCHLVRCLPLKEYPAPKHIANFGIHHVTTIIFQLLLVTK